MTKKEALQEEQYDFPYHYLTSSRKGNFSLSEYLQWGLMHLSYMEYLNEKIKTFKFNSLLDAGCGDGRLIFELEKSITNCSFLGIDISERALHFARGFTKQGTYLQHDIIAEPVSVQSDLCTSIEVIEHIPPSLIPEYIKNIAGSLNDKGTLIITTPTDNYPVHRKHYQHFNQIKITELLSDHFNISEVLFLNKENYWSRLMARLLANKYFVINHNATRNLLYRLYKKYYLYASRETGSRIVVIAIKK